MFPGGAYLQSLGWQWYHRLWSWILFTVPNLSPWVTLARGAMWLVVLKTLQMIWKKLLCFFHTSKTRRHPQKGQRWLSYLQVISRFLHGEENPNGPLSVYSTSITLLDIDGTLLLEDGVGLSFHDKIPILSLHRVIEMSLNWITLKHVDNVAEIFFKKYHWFLTSRLCQSWKHPWRPGAQYGQIWPLSSCLRHSRHQMRGCGYLSSRTSREPEAKFVTPLWENKRPLILKKHMNC